MDAHDAARMGRIFKQRGESSGDRQTGTPGLDVHCGPGVSQVKHVIISLLLLLW